ncbi:unnamed protein product, partial [Amoebophrya sp. A120]
GFPAYKRIAILLEEEAAGYNEAPSDLNALTFAFKVDSTDDPSEEVHGHVGPLDTRILPEVYS